MSNPPPQKPDAIIDKDRVAGSAKQVKGAVKQVVGKAVGDAKLGRRAGRQDRGQSSERNRCFQDTIKGK
jgi:uncharacterized protein YjbJ (UPF0337 family)